MDEYAISAEHLTKVYRLYNKAVDRLKESFNPFRRQYHTPFYALNDVSLQIKKGETFGIIGKNGSGKSTLLKILTGTLTPTSGRLAVQGRVAALLELGAGFNPEMTGLENIYFSGTIMGFSRKVMEEYVEKIVDFADIGDFIYQPAKMYSSGMFARLAFAVNTILEPDVFIVDEALAVGDAAFVQRCMVRFRDMQHHGTTIILVTHDASMVQQLCGRALWLDAGKIRQLGDAKTVTDAYTFYSHSLQIASPSEKQSQSAQTKPNAARLPTLPMPKIDRRVGNQAISIVGMQLYNSQMQAVDIIPNNSWAVLQLAVRNNRIEEPLPLCLGYLVRNRLGVDIASCDNTCIQYELGSIPLQSVAIYRIDIHIPLLYPQNYSLSPSVGYQDASGNIIMSDFIENAICFDVTSASKVYINMCFESKFSREVL